MPRASGEVAVTTPPLAHDEPGLSPLEVRRLQRELRQANEELAAANAVLRENEQRLEQRVAERTHELATLLEVSRNVTSTLALEPLLGQILDQFKAVIDYDAASIFVLEGDLLQCRAYRGPFPEADALQIRYSALNAIDQQVIASRQPIIIPDLHGDTPPARYFQNLAGDEMTRLYARVHTWMRVPLIVKDTVVGVLTLHHHELNRYSARHAELTLAFAHQAASALENARLFATVEKRTAELTALLNVTRSVTSTLEIKPLLGLILDQLQHIVGYQLASLCSLEDEVLVLLEQRGAAEPMVASRASLRDHPNTLKMLQTGQPLIIPDLNADTYLAGRVRGNIAKGGRPAMYANSNSWMSVPLIARERPIGVLELTHSETNYYTPARAELVMAFANYAAIAIENARLFEAAQARTREFTTLLEVSRNVASTLELVPLLGLILQNLKQVVNYTGAAIATLEGDEFVLLDYNGPMPRSSMLQLRVPLRRESGYKEVYRRRAPVIIGDLWSDEPHLAQIRADNQDIMPGYFGYAHSWMGVPLLIKETLIGVLRLDHTEPHYFTEWQAQLALAFAHQAAIAIENARVFTAEQRRAEQFRVISELSYRITSILAVDELVMQTVRLIRETFGYYHVHIGFIEDEVVTFQPNAGLWRDEPRCVCCAPYRLRVGRDGISGHVAASGQPILVPDVTRDPRFIRLIPDQVGSELVLPLQVKGQVIGVLDVESEHLNAFTASDVAVLQSFANQTAVALENARLYKQAQQFAALEERQKLARELHDSVSQALYGIALGARTARAQLERDVAQVAEPLDYVLALADAGLSEMRALIFELRPESLQTEGLVAALTKQTDSLRVRHRLTVHTTFDPEPDISLEVKEALYRIAQEALHNIAKHAKASRVEVKLETQAEEVRLEISDDGVGFDPHGDYPGHLGLRFMRERVERLGGVFEAESAPGRGACIQVHFNPNHRLS